MPNKTFSQTCACPCGASRFVVTARPRARFLCHCTICQSVYRKPYADATALWAGEVALPEGHTIQFKKYRLPPALSRGTCSACGAPVVGFLRLAPFVRLAFVPSANYPDQSVLPDPGIHMFYNRRVADINDAIPKHSGYWRSQWAATTLVMSALFHGPARA